MAITVMVRILPPSVLTQSAHLLQGAFLIIFISMAHRVQNIHLICATRKVVVAWKFHFRISTDRYKELLRVLQSRPLTKQRCKTVKDYYDSLRSAYRFFPGLFTVQFFFFLTASSLRQPDSWAQRGSVKGSFDTTRTERKFRD